jgi:hypothetical protein
MADIPSNPGAGQIAFPTKEEQAAARLEASGELAKQIREGKLHLAGLPFAFERISLIVEQAPDSSAFLRELVLLAWDGVSGQTQEYLQQFRTLCHPKTKRMFPFDRALILLSYRETGDGPTMVLPRIEGAVDTAERWQDAEKKLAAEVNRLAGRKGSDDPDSTLGGEPGR